MLASGDGFELNFFSSSLEVSRICASWISFISESQSFGPGDEDDPDDVIAVVSSFPGGLMFDPKKKALLIHGFSSLEPVITMMKIVFRWNEDFSGFCNLVEAVERGVPVEEDMSFDNDALAK
jgi:hypothetical protein